MRVSVCLGAILIPEYLDFYSGYSAPRSSQKIFRNIFLFRNIPNEHAPNQNACILISFFVGWFVLLVCLGLAREVCYMAHIMGRVIRVIDSSVPKKLTSFVLFHQIILLMSYPALALSSYGMTTNFP